MFSGCITALVTPMHPNGEIDVQALSVLVDRQLQAGINALVVMGTTGEAPTLTAEEQNRVIRAVVEQVNHRVPVIAGTGSNCTKHTIERTKQAMELGVDGCLIVTPYYNRPTQTGLYEHYKAVADVVPLPLILYNVPGRTGCDLLPATVERLSHIPNVVAIKDCVSAPARAQELLYRCEGRLSVLTGNDEDALAFILLGYKGIISAASNVAPRMMQQMCQAAMAGQCDAAHELNRRLLPLIQKLFVEANPIPCKWALQEMKLVSSGIRLPLTPLAADFHDALRAVIRDVE